MQLILDWKCRSKIQIFKISCVLVGVVCCSSVVSGSISLYKCSSFKNLHAAEPVSQIKMFTPTEVVFELIKPKLPFECKNGMELIKIPIHNSSLELPGRKLKPAVESNHSYSSQDEIFDAKIEDLQTYYFSETGNLINDEEYFTPDEYCINDLGYSFIEAWICTSPCSNTKENPCIRKCCEPGHVVDLASKSCQPIIGQGIWSPVFYVDPYTSVNEQLNPHFLKYNPGECNSGNDDDNISGSEYSTEIWPLRNVVANDGENSTYDKIPWRLLRDGSVAYLGRSRKWMTLASDKFCVDGMVIGSSEYYTGDPSEQVIIYCSRETDVGSISYLYVPMMFVSCFFLLLTASVYILLFDTQNIHGWTVLGYCFSMFFMYAFLATAHLLGTYRTAEEESGSKLCASIGVLAHFFFLSAFCWLTIINLDLCWTFRSLIPGIGRSKGFKRFLGYLAFAMGIPLAVVVTGIVLDKEFQDPESGVTVPEYGQISCFIIDSARGVYLYYIIGALLTCNFILIIVTVVTIYRLQQHSKIVLTKRSTKHHQSFKLFVKLFVIMGVTWVFEILSWALSSNDKIEWYWIVLDMVNLLQAIAIFVIFVCKRSTLNQVYAKLPRLKKFFSWLFKSFSNASQQQGQMKLEQKSSSTTIMGSLYQKFPNKIKPETVTKY